MNFAAIPEVTPIFIEKCRAAGDEDLKGGLPLSAATIRI